MKNLLMQFFDTAESFCALFLILSKNLILQITAVNISLDVQE